ncbi:MAG: response regulator [Candidatus Omnitrophota bacterium]
MNYKILIAEDEADALGVLSKHLKDAGYDIVTATDGEDALNKIKDTSPDIILLDINMPKKNGFEVLCQLRANPPSGKWQPAIIISTKNEFDSLRKGYELDADYYITKPFTLENVSDAVKTMISLIPIRRKEE